MRRLLLLAISLAGFALAVSACGPSSHTYQQEPISDVEWLPAPNASNPVAFGVQLHDRQDLRELAVAEIASQVHGRLPGVRFMVVHAPVYDYQFGWADSDRKPGPDGSIVFGWYIDAHGVFRLLGVVWEIEHIVAGTNDDGSPL